MPDERDKGRGAMGDEGSVSSDGRDAMPGGRDTGVGDLLRSMATPDHAPGYWESLDAQLETEAAASEAQQAGATQPDGAAEPADRASRRREPRRARRWWRPALAAAAVAATVVAVVTLGLPGARTAQPEPATAAEVTARVVAAMGDLRTVQGVLVDRSALGDDPAKGYLETSTQFWMDDRGDWAQASAAKGPAAWGDGVRTLAFDSASRRLVETREWKAVDKAIFTEWSDAPIGAPDAGVVEALRFRAFARAVDAFRTGQKTDATYRGRPAWTLTAARQGGEEWPGKADGVELIVDQETAVPVRWTLTRNGAVIVEQRVDGLVVDEQIDPSRFAPEPPVGATRRSYDAGYRQLSPPDIAADLPFAAYVPAAVPEGFVPRGTALARREWRDPEADALWNALALPAALFAWRRGFDELSVSTRPFAQSMVYENGHVRMVADPFESTLAWLLMRTRPSQTRLTSGALAGLKAHIVVGAWAYPHLWVVVPARGDGAKLIVTVAGDATAHELVAVAESLEPLE
jgi:hypothetical protein